MSDPTECACGCGLALSGRQRLYASDACKSRHWKEREGYALQATRERCQTPKGRGSGPSGLQVSRMRMIGVLAEHPVMIVTSNGPADARRKAETIVNRALSDRQRARLNARLNARPCVICGAVPNGR